MHPHVQIPMHQMRGLDITACKDLIRQLQARRERRAQPRDANNLLFSLKISESSCRGPQRGRRSSSAFVVFVWVVAEAVKLLSKLQG